MAMPDAKLRELESAVTRLVDESHRKLTTTLCQFLRNRLKESNGFARAVSGGSLIDVADDDVEEVFITYNDKVDRPLRPIEPRLRPRTPSSPMDTLTDIAAWAPAPEINLPGDVAPACTLNNLCVPQDLVLPVSRQGADDRIAPYEKVTPNRRRRSARCGSGTAAMRAATATARQAALREESLPGHRPSPMRDGLGQQVDQKASPTRRSRGFTEEEIDVEFVSRKSLRSRARDAVREGAAKGEGVGKRVFMDADEVKEMIRQATTIQEYNVKDLYRTEGWAQRVAKSDVFENVTLIVIAINALWMWPDSDYNDAAVLSNAELIFQVMENSMCLYFTIEIIIRFLAFKNTAHAFRDLWFCFDMALVFMMVVETWLLTLFFAFAQSFNSADGALKNTTILRLLRLLRIIRAVRLMRLVRELPELMILIKGLYMAARTVILTMLLLTIVLYVFAIAMTNLLRDTDVGLKYFSTVPISMKTLLLHGCFLEGLPEVVNETGDEHPIYGALVIAFVILGSVTIMNMLVGVLVEVVSCVASIEKEQLHVDFVKSRLKEAFKDADLGHGSQECMTIQDFEKLLTLPKATTALQEVGVDVIGLVDFRDFIFEDCDSISFQFFMETVLQFRGSNTCTVKDLVDLRRSLKIELNRIEETVDLLGDDLLGTDKA